MTMLEAIYVDTVEDRSIVAIKPKPALRPLFEVATNREESGVILYNETPHDVDNREAESLPCFWWRRGRDELHQPVNLEMALREWKAIPARCLS